MQRKKDSTPSAAPTSHPQQATGDSSSVNAEMFDSSMHGLWTAALFGESQV